MKFAVVYRTQATYSDNTLYVEAYSEEHAREIFTKTISKMKYFQEKGLFPNIVKVEKVED